MDFYEEIKKHVADEASDDNTYLKLAEIAPTEKARKILTDIAHDESMHHKYLKEILSDCDNTDLGSDSTASKKTPGLDASKPVNYPSYIENVGVNPDLVK